MMVLIVLIAEVKYPSSDVTYLTASSYLIEQGKVDQHDKAVEDFRGKIETDNFKIVNMLVYVVPREQIQEVSKGS